METKLFEVRDRGTFIPAVCIKLSPSNIEERYLIAMAGYGLQPKKQSEYILMGKLNELNFQDSPFGHPGFPIVRTMGMAHQHVQKNWDELKSGDVIDVEFIMGETTEKKESQRLEGY